MQKNLFSIIFLFLSIVFYTFHTQAVSLTIVNEYRSPIELNINDQTEKILAKGGGGDKSRFSENYTEDQLRTIAKTIKIRQENKPTWHRGIRSEITKNINAKAGIIIFIEDTTNIIHFDYDTFAYNSKEELRNKIISRKK